ncbi:MAG: S8 family serine peptidase [Phycisphaerae bacterium]
MRVRTLDSRLGIAVGVAAVFCFAFPTRAAGQGPPPEPVPTPAAISPQAIAQIKALAAEKHSWTPVQQKITSKLLLASKRKLGQPTVAGLPALRETITTDASDRVLVDIRATVTDALLQRIAALGGQVVNHFGRFDAIRARVPLAQIQVLAAEAAVVSIRPADRAMTRVVVSEGDVAHKADQVRDGSGIDGTGVKIGVLSDSVDALPFLQALGELPTVTVLPGQSGNPGSSEGTAMLEIVHDLAPGAELFYATAFAGQASFAQNILDLRAAGCDVLVDDIGYFAESAFQDGVIAQAIETVVAGGAVYFSAAGNSGNLNDGTSGVWEGDFSPALASPVVGVPGTAHDFGGGANFNRISGGFPIIYVLQWSDANGQSSNDYDLYLLDSSLSTVLDSSTSVQNGNDNPIELIGSSGSADVNNKLVIVQNPGAADRFLHLNTNGGILEIATDGQMFDHAAAANGFGIAAVDVARANGVSGVFTGVEPVETFSSDGPRHVFYEADGTPITPGNFSSTGGTVRAKPDLAAADGVITATPGFDPFFGTSAAAPHAAAIAGLLKSAKPSLSPADIRNILTSTAMDIEAPGFDRDSGAGIIDALEAVLTTQQGCPAPTASCQDVTVVLAGDSVLLTAVEVDNGSLGGLGCGITLLEIKRATDTMFRPRITLGCADAGPQVLTFRVTQDDGQTAECTLTLTLNDTTSESALDCNGNGRLDECEIATGSSLDCNGNNFPDECDIASGQSADCNGDAVPDECDPDILAAAALSQRSIPFGQTIGLGAEPVVTGGQPPLTYRWTIRGNVGGETSSDPNPTFEPVAPGTYTAQAVVTDAANCSVTVFVTVKVTGDTAAAVVTPQECGEGLCATTGGMSLMALVAGYLVLCLRVRRRTRR